MKKIFIIAVMLITSLCANCFTENNQTKLENVVNETNSEMKIGNLENTENIENKVIDETLENETELANTENVIQEEKQVDEIQKEKETTEVPKSTHKTSTTTSQNAQNTDNSQSKIESENKTTDIEQNSTLKPNDTNKKAESKILTPDDLEYWCVGGGTNHVAGDGENEHGYYSSWDEAEKAFKAYTEGWESVQYKIDHCSCGRYYFWAIK